MVISNDLARKFCQRKTNPSGEKKNRELCPALGAGWTQTIEPRQNVTAVRRDSVDRYYFGPAGQVFGSLVAAQRHQEMEEGVGSAAAVAQAGSHQLRGRPSIRTNHGPGSASCTEKKKPRKNNILNSANMSNVLNEKKVKIVKFESANLSRNSEFTRRSKRQKIGCGICSSGFIGSQMWLLVNQSTRVTEPELLQIAKHLICTTCFSVTSNLGTELVPLNQNADGQPLLSMDEFRQSGLSKNCYYNYGYGLVSSVDYAVAMSGQSLHCKYYYPQE